MVSGRALVLLVIVVLLLVAMVIIVGAALMQKPTRAWRLQWQENASDLKRSGIKTLRGEPVQPRLVSFTELLDDPYVRSYGVRPEIYQSAQTQFVSPQSVQAVAEVGVVPERVSVLTHAIPIVDDEHGGAATDTKTAWEDYDGDYNYFENSGYEREKPEEPQLTFDEKRELDLIGSWNPGPAEISPVPEIAPGQFWATVTKSLAGVWSAVQTRYADWNVERTQRKLAAEEEAKERAERQATEDAEAALGFEIPETEVLESADIVVPEIESEVEITIEPESGFSEEAEIDTTIKPESVDLAETETESVTEPNFEFTEALPPPPPPPSAALTATQENLEQDENQEDNRRIFDEYDEDIEPTTAVPAPSEPEQLGEWVGGLRYLSEPRPEDEWRKYVPRIEDFRDSLPPED
ncbi:hypothetical protein U6G28_11230 [Actinomycetaceae bacterium MB13-C1-2]|nr:hypothetical protein U6G28_11230 [Actinomycetaceae bacterium MB13-C1-2]